MKAIFIFSPLLILAGTAFGQIPTKEEGRFRIAVLACHRQFEPAPALARYLEVEPDLCLWIGDNVYADAPDDPAFIQTCYDALVAKPAFRQLTEQFDYMATWDDHDFGLNDAGKEYRFKAESKAMFRKFWQLEDVIPAGQDGIYYTRHFQIGDKDLQVIMLDVRYNRDAQDGSGDVLGESQWQWLEKQLTEPADLRLIVSGFQILLDREAGSETWDKFPLARRRLFNTIRKNGAQGVFFLTGDQHYGEVCRLRNALDFDAVELQFAGINQIEDPEFNPLRVAPVIRSKHSVAVIDLLLKPTEEEVPHLLFQIADAMTNQTELRYRVNLDEINLQLQFTGPAFFVDQHQIALDHFYPHLEIRYTLDGSEPTAVSQLYTEPFTIDRTTTVNARYFTWDHQVRSPVFSKRYERLEPRPATESVKDLSPGLAFHYYEGEFEQLPDFSTMQALRTGTTTQLEVAALARREDHYALVFEGWIEVPASDTYSFFTISDDGSSLFVGEREVVNNDGSHSRRRKNGLIALEKGLHPIRIEYFEDYSGQLLEVGYVRSDGTQTMLTSVPLFH